MNRFKYNLKRYVFSGRYFVRNALVVMILATVISIGAVGIHLISTSEKDVTAKDEQTPMYDPDGPVILDMDQPAMIAEISKDELSKIIEENGKVEVSAKKDSVLAKTKYDMTSKFICTEDALNIRETADEEGEILGRMYVGAAGDVLGTEGDWTKIKSGDITGYVATDYILTGEEASAQAEDYMTDTVVVKDEKVCVREYGVETADVLYHAAKDEVLILNEKHSMNGWYNIRLADGSYGYISEDFVTVQHGYSEAYSIDEIDAVKTAKQEIQEELEAEEAKAAEEAAKAEAEAAEEAAEEEEQQEEAGEAEEKTETEEKKEEKKEEAKEEKQEETKSEEKKETKEDPIDTSATDLYLLAAITYCEAGAEPYEGQLAVANVVLNRLRSGKYGSTLSDVIYAPYQFTGCQMSTFQGALKTGGSSSCLMAAQEALSGKNNIGGCYYFRPYRNVNLGALGSYTIIGTHVFY